ncbi:MAG: hypothetical protein ACM32E_03735 [Gemmatimonadota bacterium]
MDDDGRAAGTGDGSPAAQGASNGDGGPAAEAAGAAAGAGVQVRAVSDVPGLHAVAALFAVIWDTPQVPPMPHDLMRSLAHAGGCVHAAYRGGQLTGASVTVFGPPASRSCYSLITGVAPGAEGRGTGLALKLAQREWALAAGATAMTWTFDPLLRRNARFNLARLGARVTEYLPDFYGEISDGINDPETDRLAVTWDLRAPLPAGPLPAGPEPGAGCPAVLSAGPAGEPAAGIPVTGPATPARACCAVPADIMAARRTAPGLARQWRLAVREHLGGAMASGYQVTGYAEPGWYLLDRSGGQPGGRR